MDRTERRLRPLVAEPGPDDGVDPRLIPRDEPRITNRKALQLCGQVARALQQSLADCADDVLRDLMVVSVEPAPNAGRLLVTLTPSPTADPSATPAAVSGHLARAAGMLRAEVAAHIHRRRAPELAFRLA